jgi:hypothetical protein
MRMDTTTARTASYRRQALEAGSWKLGAGSWELGAGSWKLEADI